MQTADHGTFPRSFGRGWNEISKTEGMNGFYKGLPPLWMR
jgi:solute carrier family 25 phosphate transporter 3